VLASARIRGKRSSPTGGVRSGRRLKGEAQDAVGFFLSRREMLEIPRFGGHSWKRDTRKGSDPWQDDAVGLVMTGGKTIAEVTEQLYPFDETRLRPEPWQRA
jgi:hypothetical protein